MNSKLLKQLAGAFAALAMLATFVGCAVPGDADIGVYATYDDDWGYYDDDWFNDYYADYDFDPYGYGGWDYYDDDYLFGWEDYDLL